MIRKSIDTCIANREKGEGAMTITTKEKRKDRLRMILFSFCSPI
jgi:hypothetical protein